MWCTCDSFYRVKATQYNPMELVMGIKSDLDTICVSVNWLNTFGVESVIKGGKSMPDKRNLYFIDSNGQYRLLKSDVEKHEADRSIRVFLDEHNFLCYYTRQWQTDEGIKYDVGSHTEFFLWGFKND